MGVSLPDWALAGLAVAAVLLLVLTFRALRNRGEK
jgi:hypothetical protein